MSQAPVLNTEETSIDNNSDSNSGPNPSSLISGMVGVMVGATMMGIMSRLVGPNFPFGKGSGDYFIWLVSPSGKYYRLPFNQGLRIARRQSWNLAEVKPPLTKRQALRRLLGLKVRW